MYITYIIYVYILYMYIHILYIGINILYIGMNILYIYFICIYLLHVFESKMTIFNLVSNKRKIFLQPGGRLPLGAAGLCLGCHRGAAAPRWNSLWKVGHFGRNFCDFARFRGSGPIVAWQKTGVELATTFLSAQVPISPGFTGSSSKPRDKKQNWRLFTDATHQFFHVPGWNVTPHIPLTLVRWIGGGTSVT